MTNIPQFYMCVGLPGSGKSWWTNEMLINNKDQHFVVLSTDNIIEDMAKAQGKTYSDVWNSVINVATKINNKNFEDARRSRQNIIWDQTNLSVKKRRGLIMNIHNYEKIAVVFEQPLDIIFSRVKQRARETGKNISKDVILNMQESYIRPTLDEGFDKIIII